MDPHEFSWNEDQQVTVTNPTANDYRFKVHSKDYEVKAGATAKMPGFIAWVYVYGLASQMCQADKNFHRWNEEGYRKEYFDKITVGADDIVQRVDVRPYIEQVEAGATSTVEDSAEATAFPDAKVSSGKAKR